VKAFVGFGRFWYDFIVGDEWVIAVIVVLAVGVTAIATRLGWNAWPLLPVAVAGTLALTAWRAVHRPPPPS
jgi:hypothetical protein